MKKDRGNSLANSKPDDTRFQVWRPLAEAWSLLETVLRVSARRPRTPWGQSDLNCADIALDVPALAGSGTAGVAVGVLSDARHLAACSAWGRRVGLQRFAGAKHARITGKGWSSTLPSRMRASQLHTPAAFTRTSSCPVAGSGRGRSSYVITFGGPNRTTRAALICPFDEHARSFHFITLTVLQVDCQGFRALFFSTLRNGRNKRRLSHVMLTVQWSSQRSTSESPIIIKNLANCAVAGVR